MTEFNEDHKLSDLLYGTKYKYRSVLVLCTCTCSCTCTCVLVLVPVPVLVVVVVLCWRRMRHSGPLILSIPLWVGMVSTGTSADTLAHIRGCAMLGWCLAEGLV